MELVLGIDDAGRGPVIGPMVLAGVLLDKKHESYLKKLGVTDSKKLTPKRREFLVDKIKEKVETFEIIRVKPIEIDETLNSKGERTKLNEIEARACAEIINRINKGFSRIKVVVDCPSTSLEKWKAYLLTKIENLSNLEISCEHKADKNHLAVSAASILAKSTREKEMDKLKEVYGQEIGSGYTSDPLTQKFVAQYAEKFQNDGIFRKTWKTWQKAFSDLSQKRLF